MPKSAAFIWAPFVCCCHGGPSTGVGSFNGRGDTLVHKMTASSNKEFFVDSPIMAPAFVLSWNGLLNTSYKISTQLSKGISAAI